MLGFPYTTKYSDVCLKLIAEPIRNMSIGPEMFLDTPSQNDSQFAHFLVAFFSNAIKGSLP